MARNSEKALAVLNRWTQLKTDIIKGVKGRRPRDTSEIQYLNDAEYWRSQITREITRKVTEIQNAGLGEHRIRDLNDEINRLLREKDRWEQRIKELGGADYKASSSRVLDAFGAPLVGDGSYRYFGAAKDLPGVRELFETQSNVTDVTQRKSRKELSQNITWQYYGWVDEDDEEIIFEEQHKEMKNQQAETELWEEKRMNQEKPKRDTSLALEGDLAKYAEHFQVKL